MLFNSYLYIFLFLPISIIGYYVLSNKAHMMAAKIWLVIVSLFFYGWWNIKYLSLIIVSAGVNYIISLAMCKIENIKTSQDTQMVAKYSRQNGFFILGIVFNLSLLGYFKYYNFFINNVNFFLNQPLNIQQITLPLGISFFTFTQIAYLVDVHRKKATENSIPNYFLFVTFFPHLLAGPVIHHKDMMPQFDDPINKHLNYENFSKGIFLFFIGLFKKVVIADTFSAWANSGFDVATRLTFFGAWATSLSYSFQIYFDFSGYTDMALGSALLFNIRLPFNFNSPYKSLNIQEFWRRWHITLSNFMRDYIYIPLGGNKTSEALIFRSLMFTFILGGLWHGAGWTFIVWGGLHGTAICIYRMWLKANIKLPRLLAWFLTFNFVNLSWIFFRANTWKDSIKVIQGMFGLNGIILPEELSSVLYFLKSHHGAFGEWLDNINFGAHSYTLLELFVFISLCFFFKNSNEMLQRFQSKWYLALYTSIFAGIAIINLTKTSQFLYFNF